MNPQNGLDGIIEEDDKPGIPLLRRSTSFDSSFSPFERRRTVRFASFEDLHDNRPRSLAHTAEARFLNPFHRDSDVWSRKSSGSSDLAKYIRPDAFATHRDTLPRVPTTSTIPAQDCQHHNASEAPTSPSTTLLHYSAFAGHRDTLARLHFRHNQVRQIPDPVILRILSFLSKGDFAKLRLVCRSWYSIIPPVKIPAAFRLPKEVHHAIYMLLSPLEFNNARHTCRAWYVASLDRALCISMLRRMGCYRAALADAGMSTLSNDVEVINDEDRYPDDNSHSADSHEHDLDGSRLTDVWTMSKRLATECRLSAGWAGSGINEYCHLPNDGSCNLVRVAELNFQPIITKVGDDAHGEAARLFTVSACGAFVLVISGTNILIYELWQSESLLRPLIVLAVDLHAIRVSMDTSSSRLAVASLHVGRTGMC